MATRQRRQLDERSGPGAGGEAGGNALGQLRQRGDELAARAQEIIEDSLSGRSEEFNRANRQTGGE
ncbi:MAG: hypothetical protein ACE5GW_06545 [Planctomycetota bacterium]